MTIYTTNGPARLGSATGVLSVAHGGTGATDAPGARANLGVIGGPGSGEQSWVNNSTCSATARYAHAEGESTTASGTHSHAEGGGTTASGYASHAEGQSTTASGEESHAEGIYTKASGTGSHAEGVGTTASGYASHTEGGYTTAQRRGQHAMGEYNVLDTEGTTSTRGKYVEIVGNGTSSARSNARTLDWSGNEWLAGSISATSAVLAKGADKAREMCDANGTLLSVGSETVPVFVSNGVPVAGTALKDGAYKAVDSSVTSGSANIVTSGAVASALSGYMPKPADGVGGSRQPIYFDKTNGFTAGEQLKDSAYRDVAGSIAKDGTGLVTSGTAYSEFSKYVPKSGGTMTGNLTVGECSINTDGHCYARWFKATDTTDIEGRTTPSFYCVFDSNNFIYKRTFAGVKKDLGLGDGAYKAVDTAVASGSANLVTSGAVATAVASVASKSLTATVSDGVLDLRMVRA